jgi:SAM-dependent methyltransferase
MGISTRVTNRIRFVLDALPRAIRDSRWFMAPIFFIWCKGRHIGMWMEFKTRAPGMSVTALRDFYASTDSLASGRLTDTNSEALDFVLSAIDPGARTLVDIGCGGGYFLRRVQEDGRFDGLTLAGCDLLARANAGCARITVGDHEVLPYRDGAFDVVACMHTLEHSRRLDVAIAELRRICRRQLIVVVPRQKYLYYTLDLHLQFFPTAAAFAHALGVPEDRIRRFGDDLVYAGPP